LNRNHKRSDGNDYWKKKGGVSVQCGRYLVLGVSQEKMGSLGHKGREDQGKKRLTTASPVRRKEDHIKKLVDKKA